MIYLQPGSNESSDTRWMRSNVLWAAAYRILVRIREKALPLKAFYYSRPIGRSHKHTSRFLQLYFTLSDYSIECEHKYTSVLKWTIIPSVNLCGNALLDWFPFCLWDAGVSTQECSPCMAPSTQAASQSKLITHSGPHPCQERCDWLLGCVTQQPREDFRG